MARETVNRNFGCATRGIDFTDFQNTLFAMSLGETLSQARAQRRITLNQAALETRIRQSVLEALEQDDYNALPPRPFLRGLLRNYAMYLNLDTDHVLDEYDIATGAKSAAAPLAAKPAQMPPDAQPTFQAVTPPQDLNTAPQFPPFEIPAHPESVSALNTPLGEPEPTFLVTADIESNVTEPTPPLNIPQEPPTFAQRIGSTRIPEVVAVIAIIVALIALISAGFNQFDRINNPFNTTASARPTNTVEPTVPPGSTPTGIPTLAQTLAAATPRAFTGAVQTITPPANATQTSTVISSTLEAPTDNQMTLTIQAEGPMEAWVIADEVQVFQGPMQNETRTWTATSRLFVQVKNIEQGRVAFNSNRILPRNQQERTELARAWVMSPQSTPVAVPPTPYPSIIQATTTPGAVSSATLTPTQTISPTTTQTRTTTFTATATRTPTRTASPTATQTRTPTRATTQTSSPTPARTRTPIASPTP